MFPGGDPAVRDTPGNLQAWDGISAAVGLIAIVLLVTPAMAVGTWTWGPGDPNYEATAAIDPGTFDYLSGANPAYFIGTGPGTYSNLYGSSGAAVGWDDTSTNGGVIDSNGDRWDGLWVQPVMGQAGWWDLQGVYSGIVVSTSQDHAPYLSEGLPYHIQGCSDQFDDTSCLGMDATPMDVFLDGWRPYNPAEDANGNGWCSDDITATFYLGGSYRFVRVEGWDTGGGLVEPKIDAIGGLTGPQPIPEFPTALLPAAFLAGLVIMVTMLKRGGG